MPDVDLSHDANLAFALQHLVTSLAEENVADLADLFPFRDCFRFDALRNADRVVLRLSTIRGTGVPHVGSFDDSGERRALAEAVLRGDETASRITADSDWYGPLVFSYVGEQVNGQPTWRPLAQSVLNWLNDQVLPRVLSLNLARIQRAIPTPPSYDAARLLRAIFVVDDGARQGTGFALDGVGLVTCAHVLTSGSYCYQATDPSRHIPFTVLKSSPDLDLALLHADGLHVQPLARGTADDLQVHSHIAVTGFPNYRIGDSGVLVPGLVIGYRPRSGVRRILTNAPIIGGMSGGPAVGRNGEVVGIAVTGADRMETAVETEEHGIIPVEVLALL